MTVKTVIILQARMNSSRLPGKILLKLNGLTVLEHIIERLKTFRGADELIVATTDTAKDDITSEIAQNAGAGIFRGSENNVLERYYFCARECNADQIIRTTADDPLTNIELLEMMFDSHCKKAADYTCTEGFPVGVQEEIVTFDALSKCYKFSNKDNHFEHVLEFIPENPELFQINVLHAEGKLRRPDVRVTLDTGKDFDIIKKYYNHFADTKRLSIGDIIDFWDLQNE